MAQRGIREYDAKMLLARHLLEYSDGKYSYHGKAVQVSKDTDLDQLPEKYDWLKTEKLVVKPDQLFGKRGKNNLILVNADYNDIKTWIKEKMGKPTTIHRKFDDAGNPTDEGITSELDTFIIEPMTPHEPEQEYYLSFTGYLEGDHVYFSTSGGVDIESNRDKLVTIDVPIDADYDSFDFRTPLSKQLSGQELDVMAEFVRGAFKFYADLHFGFLEFNPLVVMGDKVIPLDTKARLDDTAMFLCEEKWGNISFPAPFGRSLSPEEAKIKDMDEKSGASLKLTILNPKGRVWTMVAGGGASVIYADTVVDLGFGHELSNYGEYSGNPSTDETRVYAETILDLMTREKAPGGKVLIIGGGIANFTDVSKTFDGIIMALEKYADKIKDGNISIFVRRGGPNYKAGLEKIKEAGKRLNLDMVVHGPEAHMTEVVSLALNKLKGGE